MVRSPWSGRESRVSAPHSPSRSGGGRCRGHNRHSRTGPTAARWSATPHRAPGCRPPAGALGGGWGVVGQPTQGALEQVSGTAQAPVVFGLRQQPGKQVPDPRWRRAQPVVFVVVAQQHLGDAEQTSSASVTRGWAARAGTAPRPSGGINLVGQLHVQCNKKIVQVGHHGRPLGSKVCETPRSWALFVIPAPPPTTSTPIHINDLGGSGPPQRVVVDTPR